MTLSRLFIRVVLIVACVLAVIGATVPAAADDCTPGVIVTSENTSIFENEGVLIFVFIADGPSTCTIEIPYTLTAGTASAGLDYGAGTPTSPILIPIGDVVATLEIPVVEDNIDEVSESFTVEVGTVVNATLGSANPVGTIDDNDTASLSVNDVTVTEGDSGATNATFTLSLNRPTGFDVTVDVATAGDSAISDTDYTALTNSVTFTAGQTNKPVTVAVTGEASAEAQERFFLNLTNRTPLSVLVSDAQGIGTINNDDAPLSMSDVTVTEGNSGTTCATFTVSIPFASVLTASVSYATANIVDEAVAGNDYTAKTGTLSLPPGQTSQTVCVTVAGEDIYEDDETFAISLNSPTNATLSDANGVGTISNDDAVPTVNLAAQNVTEGTGSVNTFLLTATLTGRTENTVTATVNTADGTADNTDYDGLVAQPLTILPEQTSGTVGINIVTDLTDEPNETFTATLSNPVNATGGTLGPATITILDDDAPPVASISADQNFLEGAASTQTPVTFTVTLSAASANTVSMAYTLVDDTATAADNDFVTPAIDNDAAPTDGILTFTPGQTSRTLTVTVNGDAKREAVERFFLNLSAPVNATLGDNSATGRILNDDAVPTVNLTVSAVTCTETNLNAPCTVTLTLTNPSDNIITVNASTSNGTALAGQDYTALSSHVITFAPNTTSASVSVTISGDVIDELSETFSLSINNPVNTSIGVTSSANFTIDDDDEAPVLSVIDQTFAEGSSGAGTVGVVFGLVGQSSQSIVVDYTLTAGTAIEGDDYTGTGGSFTIPALATGYTLSIPVDGDTTFERDETFTLTLTAVTAATLGSDTALITLTNDDLAPLVSASDIACAEEAVTCTVMVTLDTASDITATVNYATSDGTATANEDYAAASGTLTFAPGETSTTFTVEVGTFDDAIFEGNETVTITFSNAVDARLEAPPTAILSITDNETPPTLTLTGATLAESNSGTTNAVITFTLSEPVAGLVTIDFATENGTALAGTDYVARSGQFIIPAGALVHTETFEVVGDVLAEHTESFSVRVTQAISAVTDGTNPVSITITDDDPMRVSIADQTCTEGTACDFIVTADSPALEDVLITYSVVDVSAEADDLTHTGGEVTLLAGETTVNISVSTTADLNYELPDTFNVVLDTPVNALVTDGTAVGTILNDDAPPVISISNADNAVSLTEGDNGTAGETLSLALNVPSDLPVIVTVTSVNGTATAADSDFTPVNQTVTIPAGELTASLSFTVIGDNQFEIDEQFTLELGNPQDSTVGEAALTVTIINDDTQPTLNISDVTALEGSSATPNATTDFAFTLTLSNPSGLTITFDASTAAVTATSGTDYIALSNEPVTFAPGTTSQTVIVQVYADLMYETDQTFTVELTNPSNVTFSDATGFATIIDDDSEPTLALSGEVKPEGSSGANTFIVAFTLTNPIELPVTVDYRTIDGSAKTADGDYLAVSGSHTINPGETLFALPITVNGDTKFERDEAFSVELTDLIGVVSTLSTTTLTLLNDDIAPVISGPDISCAENAASCVFTVSINAISGVDTRVDYATADGTATAGQDYTAVSGTLVIPRGQLSGTVTVTVGEHDDLIFEANETFGLTLSNPIDGSLGVSALTGTLIEDEAPPILTLAGSAVSEGDNGTASTSVTFSLNKVVAVPVTVNFSTEDGTALLAGNDYLARTGQFIIPAGQTAHTESFSALGDGVGENDEAFGVRATGVVNAVTNGSNPATVSILNDDPMHLSIGDQTCAEGGSCAFTVTVDMVALENIIVAYSLTDLTSESDDFDHTSGSVTLLQGTTSAIITVSVTADANYEFIDTFGVVLTDPINAELLDGAAVGTIPDDDVRPTLTATVTNLTLNEGNTGLTAFNYPLTLSAQSDETITVQAVSADGTALVSDADYAALNTTITFAPRTTTQTVTVNVLADTKLEGVEAFSAALSGAVNTTINAGSESLSGTILNDDSQPTLSVADLTQAEGTSATPGETTAFNVVLSLTNPSEQTITVKVATVATGEADSTDYISVPTTTVTFAPGTSTQLMPVQVYADRIYENNESFSVTLNAPTNTAITDSTALVVISNDDALPTLSLQDQAFAEGNAGAHPVNLTVNLTNPSENPISFTFATADGTALESDGDYVGLAASGYTISAGQDGLNIAVNIGGDTKFELDDAFAATVSGITGAQAGLVTATYTLTNDDAVPTLSAISRACAEADTDTSCDITISLSNLSYLDVTAILNTSDGTAFSPADYAAISSAAVNVPAGSLQTLIPVTIVGDDIYEQNQMFTAMLSDLTNANEVAVAATIIIVDDDAAPTLSLQNATVAVDEGDSGTASLTFTLVQSAATEVTTGFALALNDQTAEVGSDYAALSASSGSIAPGETSTTVTVTVTGDTDYELDETFELAVMVITNATPVSLNGTGQITNDDLQPFISATAGTVTEGNVGETGACSVTLTLSNRSVQTVSATVVTQNGTATSSGLYPDYTPLVQLVEFPPLTSGSVTLSVEVLGDILHEGTTPETISIVLGGLDNARDAQTDVNCQIVDNDIQPTVSITGASIAEGNTPTQNTMPVVLTLNGVSSQTVTAFISTADGSNSTPALEADNDYTPQVLTPVIFAPLQATTQANLPITGDVVYENDETFGVTIVSATNATVSPTAKSANFVILNDEALPTLTLSPLASPILEGTNSGIDRRAAFQAQINPQSALPVTFTWEVFGGTASATGAGADFSPVSETGVTFAPGVTSLVIGPLITQDSAYELNDTLSLRVVTVVGATPSPAVPSATITITNDDAVPTLSVSPVIVAEGNSGKQALRFALSNPTYQTVTFAAFTTQGTATVADNDFTAFTSLNPVTNAPFEITPFATGVNVAVITGDAIVEPDETFTVTITAAGNATVPLQTFGITVQNDDAVPELSLGAASITEGAPSSTVDVTVPVTLNRQSDAAVTASVCATDGTATAAGNDYVQACKPVTFAARVTSASVTFTVNGDNIYEKLSGGTVDPHFVVILSSPTNATVSATNGTANVTIVDEDPIPTLTLTSLTANATEGTGGTPNTAQFRVDLSNPTEQIVSATYGTFDVDTEGAADYTPLSGAVVTLPANSLTASFSVSIAPDDVDEPASETFGVSLSALTNATASLPLTATSSITDDDDAPVISITGDSQLEGNVLTVGLTLSRQSESGVSVVLNTADGTALVGSDYAAVVNQIVSFAPGITTQSAVVMTTEDDVREFDEAFTVTMSAPVNATLNATPSATLTIRNEDSSVLLELVANPSFESRSVLPWKLTGVVGADKVLCGTTDGPNTKSYDGRCSVQFAGNSGTKAQLQLVLNKVDIDAALGAAANDVGTEDVLRLSFAYRARATANKPLLRVLAYTTNKVKPKLTPDKTLPKTLDWSVYTLDIPLTTVSFTSLRVYFIDNSLSGKWLLDDISIIYIDNAPVIPRGDEVTTPAVRDGALPADALPFPAAPDGFRNGN